MGANRSFKSSRSSLGILRLPDESLDESPRSSIMDTFDFLGVVEVAGEGNRELKPDSSMKIVDAGRSSPVDFAEVKARLREADCDPESAARVASPKELDQSLISKDEENLFFGFA